MTSLHVDTPPKSVFIEHLDDEQGPSLEELEAYDCLSPSSPGQQPPRRPTFDAIASRRSSLPPPSTRTTNSFSSLLYSPPQSPRIPLSQTSSNIFLPGLVRRLSHVKDKESKRRKDRSSIDERGTEEPDLPLLSPRLARAHPSPRPTRRYSSHGTSKSGSRDLQGSGFVTRQNLKREIIFSDEKLLDDAKAVLEGLLDEATMHNPGGEKRPSSTTPPSSSFIKLNETPNTTSSASSLHGKPSSILLRNPFIIPQHVVMPQSPPTSFPSENILHSPVEERRMSFELARAQQAASMSSSPIRVLNIPARNPLSSSTNSHNNVRAPSPLGGERVPSRASLDSTRERPTWNDLNLPERRGSAPIVPTIAQLQREAEQAKRLHKFHHHPLSKSVSAAPLQTVEQSSPQVNKKRGSVISLGGDKNDKMKEKPERPFYARRSFSASFLNLGKIVTGLASSSSSSSRHASQQPFSSSAASATTSADSPSPSKARPSTPSFKVNSVTKLESNPFSHSALLGSPSPRTSMSGSRPSSPLVTADPVLASDDSVEGEVIADTSSDLGDTPAAHLSPNVSRRVAGVSEDGLLSPSFKVGSRPSLTRNAKSDDGTPRRNPTHPHPGTSTLSPTLSSSASPILNGFQGLRSPARTASPSPNLTKIPEVADENWTASIRGVNPTRGRRMSAADLFAPVQQQAHLPSAAGVHMQSLVESHDGGSENQPAELDFSKKPVSGLAGFSSISLDHLPLSSSTSSLARICIGAASTNEPRQRATSYSSLLSASRPATPASSPQQHRQQHLHSLNSQHSLSKTATPTPRTTVSPSPAMRTIPSSARSHRHTQSLPTPVPASSVLDIADVSGRDTSVLEASHAKFVAALTVAATASRTTSPTSRKSSRTSRLSFSAKNKQEIKMVLCQAGNEDAVDTSSDEEEEHLEQPSVGGESRGRLPKLSYGGESLTERSDLSSVSPPSLSTSLPTQANASTPSRPSSSFRGSRLPLYTSPATHNNTAAEGFPFTSKSRRHDNTSSDSNNTIISTVHSGDSHKEDDVFSKVDVW